MLKAELAESCAVALGASKYEGLLSGETQALWLRRLESLDFEVRSGTQIAGALVAAVGIVFASGLS